METTPTIMVNLKSECSEFSISRHFHVYLLRTGISAIYKIYCLKTDSEQCIRCCWWIPVQDKTDVTFRLFILTMIWFDLTLISYWVLQIRPYWLRWWGHIPMPSSLIRTSSSFISLSVNWNIQSAFVHPIININRRWMPYKIQ